MFGVEGFGTYLILKSAQIRLIRPIRGAYSGFGRFRSGDVSRALDSGVFLFRFNGISPWRPAEGTSAEEVEMQMENSLSCVGAAV